MTFAPGSVTVNVDGSHAGSGLALALFEAEVASIGQVPAALMSVGAAPFTPPAPSAADKALVASKANLAAQRMAIVLDQRISVAVADAIAGLGGGIGFTIAGAGLVSSGGGTTVDVGAGTGITVNANDVAVDTTTIATKAYADTKVSSVGGTAPIVSSGGTTPTISISAATPLAAGSMSAADKAKLDGMKAQSFAVANGLFI